MIVFENKLLKSKVIDLEKAIKYFILGPNGLNIVLFSQQLVKTE